MCTVYVVFSPTAVEMLKMASIKPVASATGSPAVQHALSQAKATASIRPMAITPANASGGVVGVQHPSASSTPPIVTVMPTTVVQLEVLQDGTALTGSSIGFALSSAKAAVFDG